MKTVKLKDISNITMGQSPESQYYNIEMNGLPFLQGRTTFGDKYPWYDTWTTKWKKEANENDILFTVRAPVGDINIAKTKTAIGRGIAAITPKNVSLEYLYYALIYNKKFFLSKSNGSVYDSININTLENVEFNIHSEDDQKKVSYILSNYDLLIENNNKRIKLLEQMIENIYKEWFVRFRFPKHENTKLADSKIGKIPNNFNVVKMQDVFEYYIGGGWGNDEEDKDFSQPAYVIRGADFPYVARGDVSTCPYRFHTLSNFTARKLEEDDIILEVSGGTAEQPVGRTILVDKDIIDRLGGKAICASFCKQIRLNKEVIEPLYLLYWMKYLYDTRMIDRFQLQSTGIINFKFEYFLKKGDVMLPPMELMQKFSSTIKPMRNEIMTLAKEIDNLTRQRDLLLPRLMSGKLEV